MARGEYLQRRETLIFIGNPGLGKTHLAISVALAACRQKRKVRFWTAASLVNELLQAQDEHRLHRFIAAALKMDLIVLDELGFIPFSDTGAQVLFTFCSELYERLAFTITTNLKFADWGQVFGDERLTAALLDRLTHHAHIIELVGESYRFRQRMHEKDDAYAYRFLGIPAGHKERAKKSAPCPAVYPLVSALGLLSSMALSSVRVRRS